MTERFKESEPAAAGIRRIKVPLPFALRYVNAYLLEGEEGITVVDPGLHTGEAENLWLEVLRTERIAFRDIRQIVLTHHHPDHYGLAGWFQERTGAPVLLSRVGREQAMRLWGPGEPLSAEIYRLFQRHGMEEGRLAELIPHLSGFVAQVSPHPDVTEVQAGQLIRMGGRMWEAIETPGHAAGHLCFYESGKKEMLCGDHVLPMISPNVSYIPGVDENPLASYLAALRKISGYDVFRAYPGHRDPFAAFGERALQLIHHHRERLDRMADMLHAPATAYEICVRFFGRTLPIHQLRFAMAETLAHLFHLKEEGRASEEESQGKIYYRA